MRKSSRLERKAKRETRRRRQQALSQLFSGHGQILLPMVGLITEAKMKVEELLSDVGRQAIETVLTLSALELAGEKSQGRKTAREKGMRFYGRQSGSVMLSDRKLVVTRPRVRAEEGELSIPAYEVMRERGPHSERVMETLLKGVSTRDYERVISEMADTTGVSKSNISRRMIEASAEKMKEMGERRLDEIELLAIYIDGIRFGEHHVIAAVGVDNEGKKHALGINLGSSENTVVVKDLLVNLVERGVDPEKRRLFIVDGSKALVKGIREVFGTRALIQRCRTHKLRNVMGYLPEKMREQVAKVIKAAFKLDWKEGMSRLKSQAAWLEKDYPKAASSLLEGLDEMFTVSKLGLSNSLVRCMTTTNIIENPNGTVRRPTNRVSRWRDGQMVLRWAASALLKAENGFRRIQGYKDLWMLEAALDPKSNERKEATGSQAAA